MLLKNKSVLFILITIFFTMTSCNSNTNVETKTNIEVDENEILLFNSSEKKVSKISTYDNIIHADKNPDLVELYFHDNLKKDNYYIKDLPDDLSSEFKNGYYRENYYLNKNNINLTNPIKEEINSTGEYFLYKSLNDYNENVLSNRISFGFGSSSDTTGSLTMLTINELTPKNPLTKFKYDSSIKIKNTTKIDHLLFEEAYIFEYTQPFNQDKNFISFAFLGFNKLDENKVYYDFQTSKGIITNKSLKNYESELAYEMFVITYDCAEDLENLPYDFTYDSFYNITMEINKK